jgi:hypothetical protein
MLYDKETFGRNLIVLLFRTVETIGNLPRFYALRESLGN